MRKDVAMMCYQEAYSKATSYTQLTKIAAKISRAGLDNKPIEDEESSYLSKLYDKNLCEGFSEDLKLNMEIALTEDD